MTELSPAVAVDSLAKDIDGAIQLREMLFQRSLDREFISAGGRICYAIDTNILYDYFKSTLGRGTRAEVRIFDGPPGSVRSPSEERVFDIIVSDLVQNLAIRDKTGSPLILLPRHVEETRILHDKLIRGIDATKDHRAEARKLLTQTLRELGNASPQNQLKVAEKKESKLHELLYAVAETAENLKRFNALLASGRLRAASKLHYDPTWFKLIDGNSEIQKVLQSEGTSFPVGGNEGSAAWWQHRLHEMPLLYASNDARALEALDRLNRLLKDKRIRIVIFTRNDVAAREGMRYRPFRHSDSDLGRYTFSDLYIRQPKALLFEPEILLPGSNEGARLDSTGWLDAFLSRVMGTEVKDLLSFRAHRTAAATSKRLRSIAQSALGEWRETHAKLFDDWTEHLDNISLAHVSTSAIARHSIQLRLGPDAAELPSFESLEREIDALTEASWDDFFLTAAKSGYEMIGISADKVQGQKRNVPILFLRKMETGEKVLKLIYEPDGVIDNENEIRDLLAQIDDAPTRYARYLSSLCYALLFAYADRWMVARTLAKRAVDIAENAEIAAARETGPKEDEKVSGREAYYLACVTHRLTSLSAKDLAKCFQLLSNARDKLAQDKKEGELTGYPEMTGLRFDAEEIALETAGNLFEAFDARWEISSRENLVGRVRRTAQRAIAILDGKPCSEEQIQRAARVTLRTNYFSNLFMLDCAGDLRQVDLERLRQCVVDQFEDLKSLRSKTGVPDFSAVDMRAMMYAISLALPSFSVEHAAFLHWLAPGAPPDRFLMPYDRSRYDRMASLVQSRQEDANSENGAALPQPEPS